MPKNLHKNQQQISKIEITNDKISGRGGLAFFLRYVEQIGFYELSEKILGHLRISSKGLSLYQFIKQMLAYFIDGTYMSIESFNDRKKDSGYTALLENKEEAMSSSHQIKSWTKFRRAIFTTLDTDENGQLILEFARPDTIVYTNPAVAGCRAYRATKKSWERRFINSRCNYFSCTSAW